jgi:hypothetical protein
MTQYFDHDFDFDEWAKECQTRDILPPSTLSATYFQEDNSKSWENFFESHVTGGFFKMRKYLSQEFKEWLIPCETILEVY